jgi:hypothetical protein
MPFVMNAASGPANNALASATLLPRRNMSVHFQECATPRAYAISASAFAMGDEGSRPPSISRATPGFPLEAWAEAGQAVLANVEPVDWNSLGRPTLVNVNPATLAQAVVLARMSGRAVFNLVTWPEDLRARLQGVAADVSLTFVGLRDDLAPAVLEDLAGLGLLLPTGLLFAEGPEELADWIEKREQGRAADVTGGYRLFTESPAVAQQFRSPVFECHWEGDAVVAAELSRSRLLSIAGHGNSIHVQFAAGAILCGQTRHPRRPRPTHRVEACQATGKCRIDPAGKKLLLRVDEANAEVIFAQTCAGIEGANPYFSGSLALSYAALEAGSQAYVSTIRPMPSSDDFQILFAKSLRSGRTVGEATYAINTILAQKGQAEPAFVIFGDPHHRCEAKVDEPAFSLAVRPLDGKLVVELEWAREVEFLDIVIPLDRLAPDTGRGFQAKDCLTAQALDSASSCVLWVGVSACGGLRVLGAVADACRHLRFEIVRTDSAIERERIERRADRLGAAVSHFEMIERWASFNDPGASAFDGSLAATLGRGRAAAARLQGFLASALTNHDNLSTSRDASERSNSLQVYEQEMLREERMLLQHGGQWRISPHFPAMWRDYLPSSAPIAPRPCCWHCGRVCDVSELVNVGRRTARRHVIQCRRCGVISDSGDADVTLRLRNLPSARRGDDVFVEISSAGWPGERTELVAVLRFPPDPDGSLVDESPLAGPLVVRPSESGFKKNVKLEISEGARLGNHRFELIYVSEMMLGASMGCIHIGP